MPTYVLLTEFVAVMGSVVEAPIVGSLDLSVLIYITSGMVSMGLTDAIFGGEESDEGGDDGDDEDLDEFDDDLGDFDDDLDGFDEDLGDLEEDLEDFDDDFGGEMDDGGGSTAELESRMDDLENEVSQVSSTVGTVRSENEEISETVEGIEENVRKLLDVYEMVTRGVNPFVDEGQDTGGFDQEGFGLFDDDVDEGEELEEEVEDDITTADPESFFDDDFEDEGDGEDLLEAEDGDEEAEEEDGTTFDDLKAEYESDEEEDELDLEPSESSDDDAEFEFVEDREEPEDTTAESGDTADERTAKASGGAYLTSLPNGYRSDLLVMEWLEYLLRRSSSAATLQAIQYYEDIDWVGDEVADQLRSTLSGFEGDPQRAKADGGRPGSLTIDDHLTSLRYIGRLRSEGTVPFAFDVRSAEGGGGHGL